ncbi:MAG: FAD-binding oxidoreductase [Burkholderiales bacterium]|nr:FAD-binding oxidoreductase [Burkholderiales bacterium]
MTAAVASYWEDTAALDESGARPLDGDRQVEVAVIGGGYTGLTAALRLAGVHGVDVAVLEANRIGWGASGRNSGFALTSVGKVGLDERIRKWGLEAARASVRLGVDAVETVRELIRSEAIECDAQPEGALTVAHRDERVAELKDRVRTYREGLGYDGVDFLSREQLERDGYLRGPAAGGAIRFRTGFGLHPLKYARGLAKATTRRGVAQFDRTPVVSWQRDGSTHVLATPGGTVRARKVVMATNGYTPEHLHPYFRGRVLPAASNIVVTRPLTAAEWQEVGMATTQVYSDTRRLLFYWRRLPDDRLLFGGRSGVFNTPPALARRRKWLEAAIADKWPVLTGIGSEWFWHGNVGLSYDLIPHMNTVEGDPTIAYAMAYLGSGVALSSHCGGLAADLVMGKAVPRDTPVTSTEIPRFPLPALRKAYLAGAYLAYGIEDRWR